MPYNTIEKKREYLRKWKKTESYKKRRKNYINRMRERRSEIKIWVSKLKSDKGCYSCGESDHRCLDFDHVKPEEKFRDICRMVRSGFSKENLLKEIKKCRVVCSNCHRKKWYK